MFRPHKGDAPQIAGPEPAADSDVSSEQSSTLSPPPVAAEFSTETRATPQHRLSALGILLALSGFGLLLSLLLFLGGGDPSGPEHDETAEFDLVDGPPSDEQLEEATAAALPAGVVLASTARPEFEGEMPWRISELEDDPDLRLVRGTMKRRSLLTALGEAGVPQAQIFRIIKAFENVKNFDRPGRLDAFTVALDRKDRKIRAFEYEASAAQIYQARENEEGLLRGAKLDLQLDERRVGASFRVGRDLAASCKEAGLEREILGLLGDALDNRLQLNGLDPKGSLRILAKEESAFGKLVRYTELEAIEYRPPEGSPIRVYRYMGKRERGYFNSRGQAPYEGGWRSPVPFARISSRFNPRRRHPTLRVIRPHNGVDFAAPIGTPVYAAYSGTVEKVGRYGPSGNVVTIRHGGNIVTGYAHLSRFAAGLRPGQKVRTRQVIGYVGTTGRSTGPHLHFSAKRRGKFIDPLTLRLDGLRVLPANERPQFQRVRAELDKVLDALPLPVASSDIEDESMDEEDWEEHED